jgi:glutathione S-transferase
VRLIQIPFSHNCVKVRRALEAKGLAFETVDIHPLDRSAPRRASGQGLVPVLEDGGRAVADSTAILLYLEDAYPDRPLLPSDPEARARCLVLEDWADAAFMALTRRLAYWHAASTPGALARLFAPDARGLSRILRERAARRVLVSRFRLSARQHGRDVPEAARVSALACGLLSGRPYLVGDRLSLADVTLAAMAAPMRAASSEVRAQAPVAALLAWAGGILGPGYASLYGTAGRA